MLTPESPATVIRPVDEFRRWIMVAAILAIGAAGLLKLADEFNVYPALGFSLVWSCLYAGEAWIQFRRARTKMGWILAGATTGVVAFHLDAHMEDFRRVTPWFVIPAVIECATAWRFRRHPWVWLIATPILYGTAGWWSERVRELVDLVLSNLQAQSQLASGFPGEIAEVTSIFGAIVCARAVIGSFVARRREAVECAGRA